MERILDSSETVVDKDEELRPQYLDEYVGQTTIKENLSVFI